MTSRHRISFILGSLLAATGLLAQDQPYRITVDVAAVMVDAVVKDPSGRALTDLTQSDFEIVEDGQPQTIVFFASTETPRSILLLFDISGSTDSQRPFMAQAFNSFLALMRPSDRVAIASFAADFRMLMNWRNVEGKPRDVAVPAPQFYSNVYRSIEDAGSTFKNEKARKGIIVMTDGRDSDTFAEVQRTKKFVDIAADKPFQKVVQKIAKYGIPLYVVAINTDRNPSMTGMDREYTAVAETMGQAAADNYLSAVRLRMEHLADVTGGGTFYPRTLQEVAPLYEAVGRELGLSYTLGYTPKDRAAEGRLRKIEVRVRKEGLKVTQSRDSYTR